MFKSLRKNFLTGIAVLLPTFFTILLVAYVFRVTDNWLVDPLYQALPFDLDRKIFVILIKLLILVVIFVVVCLIGIGTELFIVKNLLRLMEALVDRVPMINRIYGTIKEIMNAFMGERRELFRSAVMIEYPRKGLYSIAFVTRSSHPALQQHTKRDLVSVFLPTTPNPTSGLLLFVPRNEVTPLPFSVEEAIKLVVSGGALIKETPNPSSQGADQHAR